MALALSSDSAKYARVDVFLMSDSKATLMDDICVYLVVVLYLVHIFIDYKKVLNLKCV